MADEAGHKIEIRTIPTKLAKLKLLENNARYMDADQFTQLVDNLKRDGVLTSHPLIYKGVVLSGNHRVQAALKAGIAEAECIEITSDLTESQRVAIQLSHNAITGKDDPNILAGLYSSLDFHDKLYSGLDDAVLNTDKMDLKSLSAGATQYQELALTFLPEQADEFNALADRLGKSASKVIHLGSLEDFDDFFDALIRVKATQNVHNSALALRAMARLANDHLDVLEAIEAEALEAEGGDGGA